MQASVIKGFSCVFVQVYRIADGLQCLPSFTYNAVFVNCTYEHTFVPLLVNCLDTGLLLLMDYFIIVVFLKSLNASPTTVRREA